MQRRTKVFFGSVTATIAVVSAFIVPGLVLYNRGLSAYEAIRHDRAADSDDGTFVSADCWSQISPTPPELHAPIALVQDLETGQVLYSKNAKMHWVPASLTKLAATAVALKASERGEFGLEQIHDIPEPAWYTNQPPDSSLMFLASGQVVSGIDLLKGLLISSGNDAAVALALLVSGSLDAFVEEMNRVVHDWGAYNTRFFDPAGLDERNVTTAEDMARISGLLISQWPWLLDRVFLLKDFAFPAEENWDGDVAFGPIVQQNRNVLVGRYPGADGLKTGYIEASGYNLIATAERDGRRVLAVVMGIQADNHTIGGRLRAEDGEALLNHAFNSFEVVPVGYPEVDDVVVLGGSPSSVALAVSERPAVTIPTDRSTELTGFITVPEYVWAPINKGDVIGKIDYLIGDCRLVSLELAAGNDIGTSGFVSKAVAGWNYRLGSGRLGSGSNPGSGAGAR